MAPKSHRNGLQIRLTESVVFLRGSIESTVFGRRAAQQAQPAMLRGLLVLELDKPMKISSIELTLEGKIRMTWPEGTIEVICYQQVVRQQPHRCWHAKNRHFGRTADLLSDNSLL